MNEKSLDIEEGLFFPSDFKDLPEKTAIYIEKGKLIPLEEENDVV